MPVFLSLPGSGRGRVKLLNPLGVSVIMIQANKYKGKGIMRKLLIYLNEYRKECILAPLFKLLEASFELIVPLVVAAIIDHGIAASNKSYIFKMGGVMEGLEGVVNNPEGTGYGACREDIRLAGKTGTAELKATKEDTSGTEIGWFTVFTTDRDAKNPILLISMVENVKDIGGSGYVVEKDKAILDEYLGNE